MANEKKYLKTLDLDAGRREVAFPDGIALKLKGITYELPAELPIDVFDPFLSDEFDIVSLVRDVMELRKNEDGTEKSVIDTIMAVLTERPTLPKDLWNALNDALAILMDGPDAGRSGNQFTAFRRSRPSIEDYGRLVGALFDTYGVSLGEAFASPASSENAGETPKLTSESTTASTSEQSGEDQAETPEG